LDRTPDCNVLRIYKNNMEYNDKIKKERIQLAMMIGIYLAIIIMIIAIIVLIKNIEEIKTDPIVYGLEKKGYEICSCYDMKGNSYDFNSEGYIQKEKYGWNIQLDN